MYHSFSAPCTTVDVTDNGQYLTSTCHWAATCAGRDSQAASVEFLTHMSWMEARKWQIGMSSWPLRRTRTPTVFLTNHNGSHVDDVSDRTLTEYAVTSSKHGCLVARLSIFTKCRPKNGQSPTSVTRWRTRQRDAARMELGVLFKKQKK